ncbi:DUF5615 family PIN-like protein [Gloeocapsa sp. PCC 73106]|uniref:DUF5615 family PIN-like protein n=1 Tax=Gloeocapsa sp. PCC 73106 TaxID=102232 RepID=UPI0002AC6431|nr:DUF5615 family PIN-like protein [Gloeocapsa sp. PCC 73106]ELR97063.1 hypothetical protein GLO73106DRAFT_00008660 [Gloeocapsa sp. PCC 73106]
MSKPRLHLDADTSIKALYSALIIRGHDVTRTPNEWIPKDASDEIQLLKATAQKRCIFTFNIKDFSLLALQYSTHGGIILAAQNRWSLSELIAALDSLVSQTNSEEWLGQIRWLNQWRRLQTTYFSVTLPSLKLTVQ